MNASRADEQTFSYTGGSTAFPWLEKDIHSGKIDEPVLSQAAWMAPFGSSP